MSIQISKNIIDTGEIKYNWSVDDKKYKKELNFLTKKTFNEAKNDSQKIFKRNFILEFFDVDWWDNSLTVAFFFDKLHDRKIPSIEFSLQFQDWENWDKPWSMSSFANEFAANVKKLNSASFKYYQEDEDSILNGFGITYYPSNSNLKIKSEAEYVFSIVEELLVKTNKNILDSFNSEIVLTYFHFPEEIKTACKQYLVYFVQFMADLGIVVDTELKDELNHTLFKVIPVNKEEGLNKIREALNIYLKAPTDTTFQVQVLNHTDIAIQQWEANILHLNSQLLLAKSLIQAKEATIEMLQLSNYQYKQLLESHADKKTPDKEEIIKGIVEVTKYEGKGFSVNLAEIIRRLKRAIKR